MNIKRIAFCLVMITMGLFSCKKKYDDAYPTFHYSAINVINATPDTVNFYLSGTRINNNSNLYPSGASGYYAVTTLGLGTTENYQFKKPATTAVLLNVPLALDSNTYNSLFIGGLSASDAFATVDQFYSFSSTNADTTAVRFVNASPTAGSLDVYINDTLKFSKCAFKSISASIPVISGIKTIAVCKTGTTTPIFSGSFTLNVSTNYTLFSQGVIGGSGSAVFSLGSMVNQQTTVQ